VGWSTGETMDFMTYYMRNTGIFPEHQNRGLYSIFLQTLTKYLEEIGYERLSSQHSPDNSKMLITKLRAGFMVTGMDLDERWGPLVRLTKLLKNDRSKVFSNCFGHGFIEQATKKN
jgi:RimJ/RimL family protein N-acetyltransferase